MKILGIGVDIIDNKRIKESIKNNKFKGEFLVVMNLNYQKKLKIKSLFFRRDLQPKKLFLKH